MFYPALRLCEFNEKTPRNCVWVLSKRTHWRAWRWQKCCLLTDQKEDSAMHCVFYVPCTFIVCLDQRNIKSTSLFADLQAGVSLTLLIATTTGSIAKFPTKIRQWDGAKSKFSFEGIALPLKESCNQHAAGAHILFHDEARFLKASQQQNQCVSCIMWPASGFPNEMAPGTIAIYWWDGMLDGNLGDSHSSPHWAMKLTKLLEQSLLSSLGEP